MYKRILLALLILVVGCAKQNLEAEKMSDFKLTSTSFESNGKIPDKYTCKGEDINPALEIEGAPEDTISLVLIMDDPDAPAGTWDHWILWNIPNISKIDENSVPEGALRGINSFNKLNYGGPCPPSGTHRYFFRLYALDTNLDLREGANKEEVKKAMKGHIIASSELVGLYSKEY